MATVLRGSLVIAVLVVLGALGTGGKLLYDRFAAMERQMAALDQRVSRAAQDAQVAAEGAWKASTEASQASGSARAAAEAKRNAEEAKSSAEAGKAAAEVQARAAQEQFSAAKAEVQRVREERAQELNKMQQALSRLVETRRTAVGLVMNLPERALRFDFDRAELRPESRELLSKIAGVLLASEGFGLAVHGHTDDRGTEVYNRQLSARRADAVKTYLAQAGISPDIISTKGYGKSSPIAGGDSEEERAKNRRVEIALTDTSIRFLEAVPGQTN